MSNTEIKKTTSTDMDNLLKQQKKFFSTGATYNVDFRKKYLKKLLAGINAREKQILHAIRTDLGKSYHEGYMIETSFVKTEIRYMLKHITGFSRAHITMPSFQQIPGRSYNYPVPKGCVLIFSTWNYPFAMSLLPLVDALAAGNTVVLKTSSLSPATALEVNKLISEIFPKTYVCVIQTDHEMTERLPDYKFDHIFFTGSKNIGKKTLERAAKNLTPVTLELGGENPCIIDETADLKMAAKRIVFGKLMNAGQTCIAPNHIYCHQSVKPKLINELKSQITLQYGKDPLNNPDYGKIVSRKHFDRICNLINDKKVIFGGNKDPQTLKIEPTVMDNVTPDDSIMHEEIFGPVFPVISFTDYDGLISVLNSKDVPLAAYLFSSDKKNIRRFTKYLRFGGGCINDTIVHITTKNMGFGGFKESGLGSYLGKKGFFTFSHEKSIVHKAKHFDFPVRYAPYGKLSKKIAHWFLR